MSTLSKLVVVNTTPILALDACNQLDLLRSLYTRVVIPQEVKKDLDRGGGTSLLTGLTATHLSWINVLPLSTTPSTALLARLDDGEAAVITLALEIGATIVCIDEKKGRKAAREEGLTVIGSIGILLLAKKNGFLGQIKPSLDLMISKGIWLSDPLVEWAILKAGEVP